MSNEEYEQPKFPPRLEWWDIYRGSEKAGELLAAFELLQVKPKQKLCLCVHFDVLIFKYNTIWGLLASSKSVCDQFSPLSK